MDLSCKKNIITDNLAIYFDISDNNSWNLNTGLTLNSLTKWSNARSEKLSLYDYGLTAFDNGRTNEMWDGLNYSNKDVTLKLFPVGYNNVTNPTSSGYTGVSSTISYLPITGVTDALFGNHYNLGGGYLQGFFKLEGYDFELLPSRYNEGITIENLLYLDNSSHGIFYLMGLRSEDKYNPYFSGETITNNGGSIIDGVFTSEDNYLDSEKETEVLKNAFITFEDKFKKEVTSIPQSENTKSNVIAFEITENKKLAYRYINEENNVIFNISDNIIFPETGWTMVSIVYKPDELIRDLDILSCAKRRSGDLIFYVNGRQFWKIKDFPEFYFRGIDNDPEKQIGVPYNISWGGGSFGLKHSWHYDLQKYHLYNDNDLTYIDSNYTIESNPNPQPCDNISGGTVLTGMTLSSNTTTFYTVDDCDPNIEIPITVMSLEYLGSEELSGESENVYFIKFNTNISTLSNRTYEVSVDINVVDIFKMLDDNNYIVQNTIEILPISEETDILITEQDEFKYPLSRSSSDTNEVVNPNYLVLDKQEYQWSVDGVSYYGDTGEKVTRFYDTSTTPITNTNNETVVTGLNKWITLRTKFTTEDNSGKNNIQIGLLIKTSDKLNVNGIMYLKDFYYGASDVLSKDSRKENLMIQNNFDSSFSGSIQKLRVYTKALSSQEVLHNTLIEKDDNVNLSLLVTKGGRKIYR